MLPRESRIIRMIYIGQASWDDLYCTDPAQHRTTAGQDLDHLDRDLSDLCYVWK